MNTGRLRTISFAVGSYGALLKQKQGRGKSLKFGFILFLLYLSFLLADVYFSVSYWSDSALFSVSERGSSWVHVREA